MSQRELLVWWVGGWGGDTWFNVESCCMHSSVDCPMGSLGKTISQAFDLLGLRLNLLLGTPNLLILGLNLLLRLFHTLLEAVDQLGLPSDQHILGMQGTIDVGVVDHLVLSILSIPVCLDLVAKVLQHAHCDS